MRKLSEWQKFERTGRVADYLAYAGIGSRGNSEKEDSAGAGTERYAEDEAVCTGVRASDNTVAYEGKDRRSVYAGYHHGDGNGSEGGTDGRI